MEKINEIINNEELRKLLTIIHLVLKSRGQGGKMFTVSYYGYPDDSPQFDGYYSDKGHLGYASNIIPKSIDEPLREFMDNIVDICDDYVGSDSDIDWDEVQRFNFDLIFDFVKKEFNVVFGWEVLETEYSTHEYDLSEDEQFNITIDELGLNNASELKVDFNGSGDSGYIDSIGYDEDGNKYEIDSYLEDLFYDKLSQYGGWEINEGSQGDFIIDVKAKILTFNFGQNYESGQSKGIYRSEFKLSKPQL